MSGADPFAELAREQLGDALRAQHALVALEQRYFERLLETDVGGVRFLFGAGQQSAQSLDGDPRDPFNGVVVLNASAATVWWTPSAGAADGGVYPVPPFTFLALPVRYASCSLAVAGADAVAPQYSVTVVRLRVPPQGTIAGPYGGNPLADTLSSAGTANAPGANQTLTTLAVPVGVYRVNVLSGQNAGAAVDTNNINMALNDGSAVICQLPSLSSPQTTELQRVTVDANLKVVTSGAAGAGSVYYARILATRIG